jgi:hypothetical protein
MSYLNLPRISFAGFFEADVNTVNNDVRNFAVDVFEPRFQTPMVNVGGKTEYNGWWNPNGSNRFDIFDCKVAGMLGPDGKAAENAATSGWRIEAQFDRTAAKIVDLDPQFQMASGIWGLRIALMSGEERLMEGSFRPAPFRDLFFGRLSDSGGKVVNGSNGASARFTGVLEDLRWSASATANPALQALKQSADGNLGRLSLSFVTYGYRAGTAPGARLSGSLIGSLGPWLQGEPLSFAPGRRFSISATSSNAPFASAANIGFFTALVSPDRRHLSLDLAVGFPLQLANDRTIHPLDAGSITVAVAKTADTTAADGSTVSPGITEGQVVTPDLYETVGTINDYAAADWLGRTGGVADFDVPDSARALIGDHPLLLLLPVTGGGQQVAIRECIGGLWTRADEFVQRVDAAPAGWVSSSVDIWAMRWGAPWSGAPVVFSLPTVTGQGDTGNADEVKPPQVSTPDNNLPVGAVSFPPQVVSGADGKATFTYWAANPNNPRGYIDGQVYQFAYGPAVSGASPMPMFEVVASHVRDAFVPPEIPSWADDVRPVLVQYSNLYPVMSQGLFSLSDFDSVAANARLLRLVFTLPIADPNYMPATRDLSAGKLRMIVAWLTSFLPGGAPVDFGDIPPLPVGAAQPGTAPAALPAGSRPPPAPATTAAAIAALGTGNDGKSAAARAFLKNAARRADG